MVKKMPFFPARLLYHPLDILWTVPESPSPTFLPRVPNSLLLACLSQHVACWWRDTRKQENTQLKEPWHYIPNSAAVFPCWNMISKWPMPVTTAAILKDPRLWYQLLVFRVAGKMAGSRLITFSVFFFSFFILINEGICWYFCLYIFVLSEGNFLFLFWRMIL